jgi:multicomponent Na+:H+ antiporter subunit F
MALTLIKLIKGPTQWDRLVAFNSFSSKALLIMILYTFWSNQFYLLDMIIILIILNLWGVLIAVRFLSKGGKKK